MTVSVGSAFAPQKDDPLQGTKAGVTIAIHGTNGFARRWPSAATSLGVEVRHVDVYGASPWAQLEGCDAFMWNVDQDNPTDLVFARSILLAAEQRGLRVFPDHRTVWHFDDKVAQKYLLESIEAPLAETWVFFSRNEAQAFLDAATYPLVFKLRRGAGSLNVRLVRSQAEGQRLVRAMFGRGIRAFPAVSGTARALGRVRRTSNAPLLERGRRAFKNTLRRLLRDDRERDYVLFQEFVPDNAFDTRVTVIGDRAFTYRRSVRRGDFRASGSGQIVHLEPDAVDRSMLAIAFEVSGRLGTQSLALDFVRSEGDGEPRLLEMSYSFISAYVMQCPGFFTRDGQWRSGHFDPAALILHDLIFGASDEPVEIARHSDLGTIRR